MDAVTLIVLGLIAYVLLNGQTAAAAQGTANTNVLAQLLNSLKGGSSASKGSGGSSGGASSPSGSGVSAGPGQGGIDISSWLSDIEGGTPTASVDTSTDSSLNDQYLAPVTTPSQPDWSSLAPSWVTDAGGDSGASNDQTGGGVGDYGDDGEE